MTAQIIQFGAPRRTLARIAEPAIRAGATIPANDTATVFARNRRLRKERDAAWDMAEAETLYRHALLKFTDEIEAVRRAGLPEARNHPERSDEERWALVDNYRAAFVRQLLTPAPNVAEIVWKRARVRAAYISPADKERVERVIADDLAFVDRYPTSSRRRKAVQS